MAGYDSICCFRSGRATNSKRLLWELTRACNLKCPFCHIRGEPINSWTLETATAELLRLHELGIKDIILSGGEPLVLPWLFPLMLRLRNEGFSVDLCTNATLIDSTKAQELASVLSEISVSIDSAEPEVHDRIRQKSGTWEDTVRGVRQLVAAGLDVHLISVVMEQDVGKAISLLDLAVEIGAGSHTFLGFVEHSSSTNKLAKPECQKVIKHTISKCRQRHPNFPINTKRLFADVPFKRCEAGRNIFALDAGGNWLPCILFSPMGEHAWQAYEKFCDGIGVESQNKDSGCAGCIFETSCGKGCPGAAVALCGTMAQDTLCSKSR